jgi:ankyrin repeat protein
LEVIFDTFRKSSVEFSKIEAVYSIEWIKFITEKKKDSTTGEIQKRSGVIHGKDIVEMIKDIDSWEENDISLPPEPVIVPKDVSQLVIDMSNKRLKAQLDELVEKCNEELNRLKDTFEAVGRENARVNQNIVESVKEVMIKKIREEKLHQEKMEAIKETAAKLQKDIEEVKEQASQCYTVESHRMMMSKLKSDHKEILQGLNAKLATELEEIQDCIALSSGGKTSKELAEEKEKKKAEEHERKKKGIPENFAPYIPKKPIIIKPFTKQKTPKKPTKIRTIFDAILLNDFDAVKAFVEKNADNVMELTSGRITPLHQACMCNLPEIAEYLIDNGADVNAKDAMKMTPLHHACIKSGDELIKLLVAKGADLQAENSKKQRPGNILELREVAKKKLLNALEQGGKENKKAVAEIFKEWPDMVNYAFTKGMRPIHLAAGFGQPEMIEMLLQYGADIETLDMSLNTPLHYAAIYGKIESVKYLLEHGANYHAFNVEDQLASDLLTLQK